jgi:tetratricopeptide (TPR) repeat protein
MLKKALIRQLELITLLVMSSFFSLAQGRSTEAEADTLAGRQEYARALDLYNKILEKSTPKTADEYQIYYKRAICYYGLEKFPEALNDINTLIDKYPQPQAKLLRAYINQELEHYDDVLKDINELMVINPDSPEMIQWRMSILMETGKYKEAQADIRKLLAYQPSSQLKSYLGLSYYYLSNSDSALIIFDEIIKEDPEFKESYLYATSLCLDEEAYELALSYVNEALKRDPSNSTLLFYKGIALVKTDKEKEGCRCLTKAFDAGIDDVGEYLKAYCYGSD